jgi:hypothetical protein
MKQSKNNGEICVHNGSEGVLSKKIVLIETRVLPTGNKKVKQSRIQAWTGPEGFSRLRLPGFKAIGK